MESLKPFLLLVVLGGVSYGVYVALNRAPPEPPPGIAPAWNAPVVEPGTTDGSALRSGADSAGTSGTKDRAAKSPGVSRGAVASGTNGSSAAGVNSSLPFGVGSSKVAPAVSGSLNGGVTPIESDSTIDRQAVASSTSNTADAKARYDYQTAMRTAQSYLRAGKLVEALKELSAWYDQPLVPAEDQAKLIELLSSLSGTVIYSRQPWLAPPHVVRAGESLENIAQQYQVPWQLLAKINGIENPSALLPGEELKVVRGPFHAQLNRGQQWLTLFVDGLYAGRFPVQGSSELSKPDGAYPVAKFPADHPSNTARRPYISLGGDLFISIDETAGGVTPGPRALRVSPQDMADVFDMLSERSQVTIRR